MKDEHKMEVWKALVIAALAKDGPVSSDALAQKLGGWTPELAKALGALTGIGLIGADGEQLCLTIPQEFLKSAKAGK